MHAVNPIPDMLSRPIVRIISDAQGNLLHPGTLRRPRRAATRTACILRTIIKTENPDRYGIRVGDYFV